MNNQIKKFLNKDVKPSSTVNTYTPPINAVCDAYRVEYFDNYNNKLMQQIRTAKLKGL